MNILGNVQTSFALVLFGGTFKTHYCPQSLVGGLVADIESRGGSAKETKDTTEGGMDLPGMIMSDRPWEDLMIGDFKFSIPSQDFEYILAELQSVNIRKFSDGQEYFKIHGSYHCLVLTPEQHSVLLETMYDMLPEVRKRSEEADREFSRRLAKIRDHGVKVISDRDKNDPRVVRVTKPPKDNN